MHSQRTGKDWWQYCHEILCQHWPKVSTTCTNCHVYFPSSFARSFSKHSFSFMFFTFHFCHLLITITIHCVFWFVICLKSLLESVSKQEKIAHRTWILASLRWITWPGSTAWTSMWSSAKTTRLTDSQRTLPSAPDGWVRCLEKTGVCHNYMLKRICDTCRGEE